MMRDQCFPAHVRWTQVAKRHDMALSALRRTLDDTHDQVWGDPDVASMAWRPHAVDAVAIHAGRRRALGAKSTYARSRRPRLCVGACAAREARDDGERGALMRATRACERFVEKVEAAKLRNSSS